MLQPFAQLGLRDEIVRQVESQGITEPTPIQQQTIPLVLAGGDIIAESQTGTGKTFAFVLPMLERMKPDATHVQGLVLTPTRELAIQITAELSNIAPALGINVLAAYGGQDVERQLRKLEGAVHFIVATPGRLLDHLRRGSVQLDRLSTLVLDEADQMLHMGFLNEVEDVIRQTPYKKQTLLFSATMPQKVRDLAQQYMRQPQEVKIQTKQVTVSDIEQVVVQTTDRGKQDALCQAIDEYRPYLAMVFCRTKRRASTLNEALLERGYASDELHGDLSQAKREQVMKRFREAKIQILVATDIAARGLDVEGVTHVFNYDIPHDAESYIHRIGRTGRAGERGIAVTFAAPRDEFFLELIEKKIKMPLNKRKPGQSGPAASAARSKALVQREKKDKDVLAVERELRGEKRRGGEGGSGGGRGGRGARSLGAGGRTVHAGRGSRSEREQASAAARGQGRSSWEAAASKPPARTRDEFGASRNSRPVREASAGAARGQGRSSWEAPEGRALVQRERTRETARTHGSRETADGTGRVRREDTRGTGRDQHRGSGSGGRERTGSAPGGQRPRGAGGGRSGGRNTGGGRGRRS
ncbi:DEAD/DEAH box helicase [Paenibacillus sp. y28]|uniref:DEAD/DEAH box helicase n=1 Tax=Paenibacillus sp. y28 TaxID=3129110 RepID=UPI003019D9A4